jgi:hypothetical protein
MHDQGAVEENNCWFEIVMYNWRLAAIMKMPEEKNSNLIYDFEFWHTIQKGKILSKLSLLTVMLSLLPQQLGGEHSMKVVCWSHLHNGVHHVESSWHNAHRQVVAAQTPHSIQQAQVCRDASVQKWSQPSLERHLLVFLS